MDKKLYHWYVNKAISAYRVPSDKAHELVHSAWIKAAEKGYKLGVKSLSWTNGEDVKRFKREAANLAGVQKVYGKNTPASVDEYLLIEELANLLEPKDAVLFLELVELEGSRYHRDELCKKHKMSKSSIKRKIEQFRIIIKENT